MKKDGMKQVGFIILGGGLNTRWWIDAEKAAGHVVILCGTYVEIWK